MKEYEKLAEDWRLDKECTCNTEDHLERGWPCVYDDPDADYKAGFLKALEMTIETLDETSSTDSRSFGEIVKNVGEKEV
jgi:hypothetical protein